MNKVLMIGLDGATFSLMKPLMDDGLMPFLKRFVAEGVHGDLISTRNPLTPPAWTSMITGRSPHVHGIYDFLRPELLNDGGVFLRVNDSRDNRCETLWSLVSRQGKRATSLNFYGMSPPVPIDGYLISGFVPWRHLRQVVRPPALFETIRRLPDFDYRRLGMDIGEEKKCVQGLVEGEHEDWIKLQDDRDTAWTDICCHLTETDPTDLIAVVLDGPDKIQHLFWRFVDPALVERDPDPWYARIRGLCLDYYRQLDRNLERMVRAAGPQSTVIVTSDHGFGATHEIVYINEWLSRRGYLKWADVAEEDETGKLTANRLKDHLEMIDWKKTLAFCPTPSSNAIYIKQTGDYLEVCLRLKQELLDFRHAEDGGQVFVGVSTNKLEGVAYAEPSPDLTLKLRDGGFVSILKSSEVVTRRAHPDGTHRPEGIFVARGPGIRSGERVEPLNLLDVAPLLLYCLGLPVPKEMEGRVPLEIFDPQAVEARRPEQGGFAGVSQAGGAIGRQGGEEDTEESAEDREILMRQLRKLGYLD